MARELIDYRWRRLGTARDAARKAGLRGALFPWQSGSDGTEQTPKFLFNKLSGHWMPDYSHLQRHVGLAVAYNAWQYFEATQDRGWLTRHGAEIVVDVARLFAVHGGATTPPEDRFHIKGVMGPDEYHTGHPGNPGGGLRRQRLHQHHGRLGVRPGGLDHAFRTGVRHGGAPGHGWGSPARKSTPGRT